jgi:acetyl/propionyl-CoA carboxylase alpha subunit
MKAVRSEAELLTAIPQARREALAAFGDGTLYVERLIDSPRHIEFQILADAQGHVVHLFERECSIQRRHQKVIEETPSTALTPSLRARMGEAAVAVARTAGYRNAGTIEFLLEGKGDTASFYFLEMNTRLQVEHPITEQVVGVDLAAAQIRIAAGEPLPWTQRELSQRGHAIELRIYAEDPARSYLPQAGPLLLYREPGMPGIRVDSGFIEGDDVSVHYDPLIAKLIASGETRQAARHRAMTALESFPILGIRTNVGLLLELLQHPRFVSGAIDTRFLDAEAETLRASLLSGPPPEAVAVAAAVSAAARDQPSSSANDPWSALRDLRL